MRHLIVDKNIEACIECYFFQDNISACLKSETSFGRGKYIDDEYTIPDWCPLPEVEL